MPEKDVNRYAFCVVHIVIDFVVNLCDMIRCSEWHEDNMVSKYCKNVLAKSIHCVSNAEEVTRSLRSPYMYAMSLATAMDVLRIHS